METDKTDSKYIPTIGLEIHAELKTASKMFCACKNDSDEEKPNANICPICMGHPGTLPVLNKVAIKNVLKIGVAVNGTIADFTEWDRKNYFYPDIPKGYQISQYKFPLVSNGELAGVALERIHLEEDTAQSTHDQHEKSLVNFNRAGVPLMELVTKPVIRDAETAVRFAKELQLLLRYLGAGEANMEKGEMRVEANISVASPEDTASGKFGTKTEVKNLNSFKVVEKAIAFEIERQIDLLENGKKVVQETRGWNENKSETFSQRAKESSHDYRYFPDPDIPKLKISEIPEFAPDILKKEMPELPWIKRERFLKDYTLTEKGVAMFIDSPELANYYESIIRALDTDKTSNHSKSHNVDSKKVKLVTNYLLTDYLGTLKVQNKSNEESGYLFNSSNAIPPSAFAELINMISGGELSSRGAKDTLVIMIKESLAGNDKISAKSIAEKAGLIQKSDASDLGPAIDKVIADNSKVVAEYKAGKIASLQFLIGQAMKTTRGAGNPEVVKKMLVEKLK